MTPLRQRMIDDMRVRNLSVGTQQEYVRCVARYARHFGKSPEYLGPEDVRTYQVYHTNEKESFMQGSQYDSLRLALPLPAYPE